MNKWFGEVFLKSIFERCEIGKQKWLSAKQTAICTQYMEMHQSRYDYDGYGTMCNHNYYTCEWMGRSVVLDYSKKNGCGCITFGMNEEEKVKQQKENEAERERIKQERIERIKRNPERLAKKIDELERKLQSLQDEYEAVIEEDDEEEIEWVLEEICKVENELKTYKN
jgi:hypothetical protein